MQSVWISVRASASTAVAMRSCHSRHVLSRDAIWVKVAVQQLPEIPPLTPYNKVESFNNLSIFTTFMLKLLITG